MNYYPGYGNGESHNDLGDGNLFMACQGSGAGFSNSNSDGLGDGGRMGFGDGNGGGIGVGFFQFDSYGDYPNYLVAR